jgi:HD-GYP domain-containing protein (c-di-GMP phosphodiesterase class II)/anti-anti-sigma regulatory factor
LATRFEPLDLGESAAFGIRLQGAFGRGDRRRLMELAARCLEKGKTQLVLDCRELDSLGGGGATVLADLQRRLLERGGEVVFVAVGGVIHRFLQAKFDGLPLRCFDQSKAALAALSGETAAADPAPPETSRRGRKAARAAIDTGAGGPPPVDAESLPSSRQPDLDTLLDTVEPDATRSETVVRRTADLVTAAYVSIDDMLQAMGDRSNPTVLGEVLSMLLDSHELAAETIFCHPQGDHFVATGGSVRLPAEGGIVASLLRARRPLTLLDLEDGDLWDEETHLLEQHQPDLILPLLRADALVGIAFLRRGRQEREYGISEVFALELLLRLLRGDVAPPPAAVSRDKAHVAIPVPTSDQETLLRAKLDLARGLQDAQDTPHFWQVFISRLRLAAEVTSLLYLDSENNEAEPFLTGEARRDLPEVDLRGERVRTFFRTLERPVEVANMPGSLRDVRDALLARGLQWLVGLRGDGQAYLGVLALGLRWRCLAHESADEIHEFMEITGEALIRLRTGQDRADMSVGLLESFVVNGAPADNQMDLVTRETVKAVRVLAAELGLPPDQERDLVLGALLRNFGQDMANVDDLVAERLTGDDWEAFRAHPDVGETRLAALKAPEAVREAVRHHHERFDGRGFPRGLRGRDVPLVARLIAVAQCAALHKVRQGGEAALDAVKAEAGKGLDPDLVEIYLKAARGHVKTPVLN